MHERWGESARILLEIVANLSQEAQSAEARTPSKICNETLKKYLSPGVRFPSIRSGLMTPTRRLGIFGGLLLIASRRDCRIVGLSFCLLELGALVSYAALVSCAVGGVCAVRGVFVISCDAAACAKFSATSHIVGCHFCTHFEAGVSPWLLRGLIFSAYWG